MNNSIRSLFAAGLLTTGLALIPMAGPAHAQATGETTNGTARTGATGGMGDTTRTVDRTDNGTNYGWLGLAGLAGLLGLMPKKTHPVVATTHRTGDNSGR